MDKMRVFISWSGARSREIALALREWLPRVIQSVEPWISAADIDAGAGWADDLQRQLAETNFAILCLTPENLREPWILFEAGAISKSIEKSRVCPYLFQLQPNDVKWPLARFFGELVNREGTWKIVQSMNKQMKSPLSEKMLEETFNLWWPKLKERLEGVSASAPEAEPKRDSADLLGEVLELVRSTARSQTEMREELRSNMGIMSYIPPGLSSYRLTPGSLLDKLRLPRTRRFAHSCRFRNCRETA